MITKSYGLVGGTHFAASRFAASLFRRVVFRRHDDVGASSYGLVSAHPFHRVDFAAPLLRRRYDVGAYSCGLVSWRAFRRVAFRCVVFRHRHDLASKPYGLVIKNDVFSPGGQNRTLLRGNVSFLGPGRDDPTRAQEEGLSP